MSNNLINPQQSQWPPIYNISLYAIGKNGPLPQLLGFGTDNLLPGIIVKNIRAIPMVEEIKIEQGSGLTVTDIIINDGDEAEISVVDDRAVSWPQAGGVITIYNPQPNGTYALAELYQVIYNNYTVARKVDGERTLLCKAYRLITPQQM